MPHLNKYLPSFLQNYHKRYLKNDGLAGVSVAILLLPQSMAYALLAGMPPIYGIYSILVAIPIYALFGQQKTVAIGPAAMVAILTSTSLMPFYESASSEYIIAAAALSAMTGIFLLLLGLLKLGFISNFISRPVISGYSFAVGILVVVSQSKYVFGVPVSNAGLLKAIESLSFGIINNANWPLFASAMVALAILIILKKISKKIPGPLLIMILSIALAYFLLPHTTFAPKIGEIPSLIPSANFNFIEMGYLQNLWPSAMVLALIVYLEISTVAQVAQKAQVFNGNRELKAMGLANFFGAFVQSFPISTSFSRSLFNAQSGAKTQLASIVTLIFVLIIVLVFKDLIALLPNFILAVVVISTVITLINFRESKAFFKADKKEFAVHILTIICTLFIGIKEGIIIGVLSALALVIYRSSKPHIAILGFVQHANAFMNVNRFKETITYKGALILRPDAQLYHGNIEWVCSYIEEKIKQDHTIRHIILQCSAINYVDSSAVKKLLLFNGRCKEKNVQLLFCHIKGPVRDQMKKWNFYEQLGDIHFFNDTQSALDYTFGKSTSEQILAKQSNYTN